MSHWSDDDDTDDPRDADDRDLYKVEQWSRDGKRVERLLYAGDSLDEARAAFAAAAAWRPRARLTLRQRTQVLDEWPTR